MALVMAIMAIMVVGALVIGVGTTVVLEHRQAQNTPKVGQAFSVSELGLNDAIADWSAAAADTLAVNQRAPFSGAAPSGAGSYTGWILRLSPDLYMIEVTGTSARYGARQRLGAFVKTSPIISVYAAARGGGGGGQGVIKNASTISGRDMVPAGWGAACPGTLEDIPGAEWQNDEAVVVEPGGTLDGAPPLVEDPSITNENVFEFMGFDYADLVGMATITVPQQDVAAGQIGPRLSGGGCDETNWRNWGAPKDPSSPCFTYFPVIHRPGALVIKPGTGGGQGVLLVDGELTIEADFHFYGVILAKEEIQLKGSAQIFGAVIVGGQLQSEPGNVIQYSGCVVSRAQEALPNRATQLRSRAWFQLD